MFKWNASHSVHVVANKVLLDISSHIESAELLDNASAWLVVISSKCFCLFPKISALSEVLFTQSHGVLCSNSADYGVINVPNCFMGTFHIQAE